MSKCISGSPCFGEAVESHTFPGVFRFCASHQAQLDGVKETMGDQQWQKTLRGKGEPEPKFCAESGCSNRPIYGSDYCEECNGGDD